MYDAFISYSRANLADIEALKKALDDRGLRVFIDLKSLRAGEDWPPQLGQAIQKSRLMVLCWSAQAEASEWVRAEINHSLSTKTPIPVLPWLLDSTMLPPMLRQRQGVATRDTAQVVEVIAQKRWRHRLRFWAGMVTAAIVLAFAIRFGLDQRKRMGASVPPSRPEQKGAVLVPLPASYRSNGVSFKFRNSGDADSWVGDAKMQLSGDNVNQEFSLEPDSRNGQSTIVKAGQTVEIPFVLNTKYFDQVISGHCEALDNEVLQLTSRVEYSPDGNTQKWYSWKSPAKNSYYSFSYNWRRSCHP